MRPYVEELSGLADCYVFAYPNAGLPNAFGGYDEAPATTARLLREFDRLRGDPNDAGATRHGIVTGYRQDALRCAAHLAEHGASKGVGVARACGVRTATRIMADNH